MKTNVLQLIRSNKIFKIFSIFLAINLVTQWVLPLKALALTTGPSQPEVESFEPVSTSDMVDIFTGSFTYNIPLFDLPGPNGGYPFNIAYHSGITMDQEASWVGLGWDLNPGSINRNMRGLPDDFNGDNVLKTVSRRDNNTFGGGVSISTKLFGADANVGLDIGLGFNIYYNNYKGVGYSIDPTVGFSAQNEDGTEGLGFNLSLQLDPTAGIGVDADVSGNGQVKSTSGSFNAGINYNSKTGGQLTLTGNVTPNKMMKYRVFRILNKIKNFALGTIPPIGFSKQTFTPVISFPTSSTNLQLSFKMGIALDGFYPYGGFSGFFSTESIDNGGTQLLYQAWGYNYLELVPLMNTTTQTMMDFNREKDGIVKSSTPNLAIPNLTYDYYSISGQGVGGMFRPYRNDFGEVYDPLVSSTSWGGSIGGDVGGGFNSIHIGIAGSVSSSTSYSGGWDNTQNDNPLATNFQFRAKNSQYDPLYETVYYKEVGEHSAMDPGELSNVGGEGPVMPYLNPNGILGTNVFLNPEVAQNGGSYYVDKNGNPITVNAAYINYRTNGRMPRGKSIQAFTNAQINSLPSTTPSTQYTCPQNTDPSTTCPLPLPTSFSPALNEYDVQILDYSQGNPKGNTAAPGVFETTTAPIYKPSNLSCLDRVSRLTPTGSSSIANHNGGYSVVSTDGKRYVYALPAYNNRQVEANFAVLSPGATNPCTASPTVPINYSSGDLNGSDVLANVQSTNTSPRNDQFFSRTEIPPYAHSYMLTSVLGADYVDVDGNGPSDNDLGSWVKFTYAKVSNGYKWRTPFTDASYNPNKLSDPYDDRGSYEYGEREQWYMAAAETKTHIAIFNISPRNDGYDAKCEDNGSSGPRYGGEQSYELDSIDLYVKSDYLKAVQSGGALPAPIKSVHFTYNYSLCSGVYNNINTYTGDGPTGKLTLTGIWFSYGNNYRGELSPYTFSYNESDPYQNPSYNPLNYDRWGFYKNVSSTINTSGSSPNGVEDVMNFPYVPQCDATLNPTFKEETIDRDAAVWDLKSVTLPTGGTIAINYESNDYAYVQDKVATEMLPIFSVAPEAGSLPGNSPITQYPLYNNAPPFNCNNVIYFLLPEAPSSPADFYNKYISPLPLDPTTGAPELYFKAKVQLAGSNSGPVYDYVSGYADIASTGYGSSYDATYGNYGYITLPNFNGKYNQISTAAWQHMRTDQPDLLTVGSMPVPSSSYNKAAKYEAVYSLVFGILDELASMAAGYRAVAWLNGNAENIDLTHSVIKLGCPTRCKYGGGARVKSIVFNDNWNTTTGGGTTGESSSTYGQTYGYTNADGSSNGVAQYEPIMGGDENVLRYAKMWPESIPFLTANNLYFEYPCNESYYPAPIIGYSKVTVRSLASNDINNTINPVGNDGTLPLGISTTGAIEYDFYTCKDFPVISEEDPIGLIPSNLYIPIPFIGEYTMNNMMGSQGYSIQLNDMHGKLESVTNYQLDNNGNINYSVPVSSTKYIYNTSTYSTNNDGVVPVVNDCVPVITGESIGTTGGYVCTPSPKLLGEDYEMFTDMRRSHTSSINGGVDVNIDISFYPPFIITVVPSPWPTIGYKEKDLKTIVTNKVIRKSGILMQTITTDGTSTVTKTNKYFDQYTGEPLLTTITNDFDQPVYDYELPAYWSYANMGPAYENQNLQFATNTSSTTPIFTLTGDPAGSVHYYMYYILAGTLLLDDPIGNTYLQELFNSLNEGDEFLLYNKTYTATYEATLISKILQPNGFYQFTFWNNTSNSLPTDYYNFTVVRSGKRNQMDTHAGNIVGLMDPTANSSRGANSLGTVNVTASIISDLQKLINNTLNCNALSCSSSTVSGAAANPNYPITYYFGAEAGSPIGQEYPTLNQNVSYVQLFIGDYGDPALPCSCADALIVKFQLSNGGTSYQMCLGPLCYNCSGSASATAWSTTTTYTVGQIVTYSGATWQSLTSGNLNFTPGTDDTNWQPIAIVGSGGSGGSVESRSDGVIESAPAVDSTLTSVSLTGGSSQSNYGNGCTSPVCIPVINSSSYATWIKEVINSKAALYNDYWMYQPANSTTCPTTGSNDCSLLQIASASTPAFNCNPFAWGERGIWRPYQDNYYQDIRFQQYTNASPYYYATANLGLAGVFNNGTSTGTTEFEFFPYTWLPTTANPQAANWLSNNTITKYNASGFEVENKDILGIYSSALYGYNDIVCSNSNFISSGDSVGAFATAVGSNMPQNQMFFESFDDPSSFVNSYSWPNGSYATISNDMAHTGTKSLKITNTGEILNLNNFAPQSGQNYVVSLWASMYSLTGLPSYGTNNPNITTPMGVQINFYNCDGSSAGGSTGTLSPTGPVIEGWQKIEEQFTIPSGCAYIGIQFIPGAFGSYNDISYYDDIRVFPASGNIKTYVYDPCTLRLSATLDENNYATLYYYDQEGKLYVVKKETIEGIKTIQEARSHQQIQ